MNHRLDQTRAELTDVLDEIERSLRLSILYRGIIFAGNDSAELREKLNQTKVAHIYNALIGSAADSLILSVFRCWESGKREGNRSFPRILRLINGLRSEELRVIHGDSAYRILAIHRACDATRKFYKSPRYRLIEATRHEGIAHSTREAIERKNLGHMSRISLHHLDQSIIFSRNIFKLFYLGINNTTYMIDIIERDTERLARYFFSRFPDYRS